MKDNRNLSPQFKETQKKLNDVVIIRSLSIIIVVFFHAYHMMYVPAHFPKSADIYHKLYYNINSFCLWFHMPIFIFMSGYLYCYLYHKKNKYESLVQTLKNKAKRLLIPFFVFCTIFMLTTNSFNWNNLLKGSWGHLWFITMLFNCFLLIRLMNYFKYLEKPFIQIILLSIFFFLMLFEKFLPEVMGLYNLSKWFFWFYLGYVVFMHAEKWSHIISKWKLSYILPMIYISGMYYMIYHIKSYDHKTFISEISFFAIVIWIWYGVNWNIRKFGNKWTTSWIFIQLNTCSYGIYIFHNWVESYMISKTAKRILPLEQWAQDHIILFPLIFSLLALIISFVISKILLISKTGKFLIE